MVTARQHTNATEFVIIISQTVFYIVLFLFLKKTLLDNQNLLSSRDNIKKKLPLVLSIIFTIYAIILILMLPCLNYIYAEIVFVLVYLIITSMLFRTFRQAYFRTPTKMLKEDSDIDDNQNTVAEGYIVETASNKSSEDGFKTLNRLKFW